MTFLDLPLLVLLQLAAAVCLGLALHLLAFRLARRFWRGPLATRLLKRVKWPSRLAFAMLALRLWAPALGGAPRFAEVLAHAMSLALIVLIGWSLLAALNTAVEVWSRSWRIEEEDNLLARKRLTQVGLLRRIATMVVVLITAAAAAMTFPAVRDVGFSLFASAGVAGIVVGFAAQPVLSNLIAGLQIAITQPIRLDDAVVVEGEWGWIEDIRGTYVVIRLWDLRRLVVPLSYFIQHPFQNWTRESASLIGTVYWYVDYSVPVAAVRAQLARLLQESRLWDGKTVNLQVTEVRGDTVELRGLVSASNSPRTWDLRCEIREKMLDWLQSTYPEALPKQRQLLFRGERSGEAAAAPAAPRQLELGDLARHQPALRSAKR